VEVNPGDTLSVGAPVKLFTFQARAEISSTDLFTYDVAKDGKRFIVSRCVKPETISPLLSSTPARSDAFSLTPSPTSIQIPGSPRSSVC
jgi:hypothetical protein